MSIRVKKILAFTALCAVLFAATLAPLHLLQHAERHVECAMCVVSSSPLSISATHEFSFNQRYVDPLPFKGEERAGFLFSLSGVLPPARAPPPLA